MNQLQGDVLERAAAVARKWKYQQQSSSGYKPCLNLETQATTLNLETQATTLNGAPRRLTRDGET